MRHLPLLFVCAADILSEQAREAIANAWALGWLPIAPPLETYVMAATWEESETLGLQAANTLLHECDALLVVGKPNDRMNREISEFSFHNTSPIYATVPAAVFPEKPRLQAPPWYAWEDAAVKRTEVEGWACKTCKRWWGKDERMARWCCAKTVPCDRCGAPRDKSSCWIYCDNCKSISDRERWEKRKREPWNGHMLYSEALSEWFQDLDAAVDEAGGRVKDRLEDDREPTNEEIAEELDDMQVVLSKPVYGRHVDLADLISDDLPEDSDDFRYSAELKDAEEALNKAIEDLGALSYEPTQVALDAKVSLEASFVVKAE